MPYEKLSTTRHGIKTFVGTKTIKAPLENVAQVLFNPDTQDQWIGGLESSTIFEHDQTTPWAEIPKNYKLYQTYKMPSPIWNRDYVIAGQWKTNSNLDTGLVENAVLYLHSIEHDNYAVKNNYVRAALNLQVYTLKAANDFKWTEIDAEINVDPLGNFPVFLVNLYGSTWCDKTLNALEKVVLQSL